jgi:hypothetical protein
MVCFAFLVRPPDHQRRRCGMTVFLLLVGAGVSGHPGLALGQIPGFGSVLNVTGTCCGGDSGASWVRLAESGGNMYAVWSARQARPPGDPQDPPDVFFVPMTAGSIGRIVNLSNSPARPSLHPEVAASQLLAAMSLSYGKRMMGSTQAMLPYTWRSAPMSDGHSPLHSASATRSVRHVRRSWPTGPVHSSCGKKFSRGRSRTFSPGQSPRRPVRRRCWV